MVRVNNMKKFLNKLWLNCLKYALLTCAALLAACGDDSSTSASDTPDNPAKTSDVAANYLNPD